MLSCLLRQWMWPAKVGAWDWLLVGALLSQGVCGALWRAWQPTGLVSHAPLFISWSPSVSPSLLKCCFWALCVCEFIETPPMPLSVLVNERTFYLSLSALSTPPPAGRVDVRQAGSLAPPCGRVEPLAS